MRAKPPSAPPLTLKALDAKLDAFGREVEVINRNSRHAYLDLEARVNAATPIGLWGRLRWLLTGR